MAASTRHSLPLLLPPSGTTYGRTADDSWAWSDGAARGLAAHIRTALALPFTLPDVLGGSGDVWAWSDSASQVTTTGLTSADTWAWSDTASRGTVIHGGLTRNASDTWAWTDSATRVTTTTRFRTASDTWAWSDTAGAPSGGIGRRISHDTYTVASTGAQTVTSTANQVTVAEISDTSPIPA